MKRKIDMLLAVAVLAYAPLAMANKTAPYPSENLGAFVVEKLDVTSLPFAYRPRKEKGKKTLADYGYTARRLQEKEAFLDAPGGSRKLSIKILQEGAAGIYACVAAAEPNGGSPNMQNVILLKRKYSNALLKGRESWREFTSCPLIGSTDSDSSAIAGGD